MNTHKQQPAGEPIITNSRYATIVYIVYEESQMFPK